jgi:hypothetical protein
MNKAPNVGLALKSLSAVRKIGELLGFIDPKPTQISRPTEHLVREPL